MFDIFVKRGSVLAAISLFGATVFGAPSYGADYGNSGELVAPVPTEEIIFDLGVGARLKPKFDGSEDYLIYPFPVFQLKRLKLPVVGEVVSGEKRAFAIYPSFSFIGKRDASDSVQLRGLRDVDWALELGAGASYQVNNFKVHGTIRRGFNGHTGFVGEFGIDWITNPHPDWQITVGPRVELADNEYMDTYFGITPAEAVRARKPAFDPDAGFKSIGAVGLASYSLTDDWRLHFETGYRRLIGDAGKSPIVKAGSADQFSVGLGLSYQFKIDYE